MGIYIFTHTYLYMYTLVGLELTIPEVEAPRLSGTAKLCDSFGERQGREKPGPG